MTILKKPRILYWTTHALTKMHFYQLSENRVKRVINSPHRIEKGIALNTIGMMQRAGSKKHPYEVWTMIQDEKGRRKVISAWRYPGITKPGEKLPEEILKDIREAKL